MSELVKSTLSRRQRLLARLAELGIDPKRSLGQNFLISEHVISKILAAVQSEPASGLIEVGPGLGALTEDLLGLGGSLVLLELDDTLFQYWQKRTMPEKQDAASLQSNSTETRVRVVVGDALQLDWRILGLKAGTTLVSNLPYQISSSLVIERCLEPAGIDRMILMFQKEVAQRLAAKPRTKEYGLLTVMAQTFWSVKFVCDPSAQDFFPPPNVSSRVMQFRSSDFLWKEDYDQPAGPGRHDYLRFIKAAFAHRRKLLSRNLHQEFFNSRPDFFPVIENQLAAHGLLKTARAEELDPSQFVRLYLSAREWV